MKNTTLTIKDSAFAFFCGFLLCQVGVLTFAVLGSIFCQLTQIGIDSFSTFTNTALGYLISVLCMDGVMLTVFLHYKKKDSNKIFSKPSLKKICLYILIAIASFFCLYPIVVCFDSLLIKLGIELNTIPYSLTTENYLLSLISLTILPAICEELLFRGIILQGLKSYGKVLSILLTGLMFAIFHMSIDQFIYPLIMGSLLSLIMYNENNILYSIIVHLVNNFLSVTLSYLQINLIFHHWTYILLAVSLALVFTIGLLIFIVRRSRVAKESKPTKTEFATLVFTMSIMILFWILCNL